jgi:hypothetical protein
MPVPVSGPRLGRGDVVTKVNISGPNHQIEVNHDGADLTYVIEKAQKLFDDTKPSERGFGAYGFSMERQQQPNGWKRFDTDPALPVRVEGSAS